MTLKKLELSGFKSFGRKETLFFDAPVVAIVGPNGSGKSNVAEAFKWVLGEQSLKSLRGKRGEDLIFNGSSSLGRLSRASVSVTFDNTNRKFQTIDFDEVVISREVFRDGTNEYKINGSVVRLRDIIELLASISLGASGHHIISQGEADRILNANPVERRAMIEDALGLKIYQWKLSESEKKLGKTEDNIKQVESIRREIAPHLKFLKKQVEKIEKVRELKIELQNLYGDYLKREELYLAKTKEKLTNEITSPKSELERVMRQLQEREQKQQAGGHQAEIIEEENQLRELETKIRTLRLQKDELARALGRLEGLLEVREKETKRVAPGIKIPLAEAESWITDLDNKFNEIEQSTDLEEVKNTIRNLRAHLHDFLKNYEAKEEAGREPQAEFAGIKNEHEKLQAQVEGLDQEEAEWQSEVTDRKEKIVQLRQTAQNAEHDFYELRAKRSELELQVRTLLAKQETLNIEEENFKRELGEAGILVGREVLNYSDLLISWEQIKDEERGGQEDRRRKIERIKIRLEDMGVESGEVLREHDEVVERDAFLAKELEDLAKSKESLLAIMAELRAKIDGEFNTGIVKINSEFQKFFALLFGGGNANLELLKPTKKRDDLGLSLGDEEMGESSFALATEDDSGLKPGVEINVSLPRKKIKGLAMLSGGERALTSIALLFAMSQVNPPPFLILDETDAALDEANSRKYADMIENLSKYSQLILITHNRETMSRASILYGVTMVSDSVSRLISIKFDEATQYAK
ncbi:MAG: AAA family ATPase [Candidatus Paceibacterota bacterium]|jgi:chromosome segregation protein